jgi:acetoin utilization protein AcuB
MNVREVMSWNVVTIPSDTPILEAKKIMETHKILRMPVVDRGKLVGMVSRERIIRVGPSPATSLNIWEVNYLLSKMTIKDVMIKDVITVTPDTHVEKAIGMAQSKGVGALPVVEDGKIVGIVTTNDFFYKVLNPILGIGRPGHRITVFKAANPKGLQDISEILKKNNIKLVILHSGPPLGGQEEDIFIQIDAESPDLFMKEMNLRGYKTLLMERYMG